MRNQYILRGDGFTLVPSYNGYWDLVGKTFEDIDGDRVVLQNGERDNSSK
ncbi:hypothetical protein [Veronia pacifica]|nr:hypothetical protein [Veronia pacifica]